MASFNKVILMGNLTRDVEIKYTPSGMAVAKIGMAMNRKYRDTKSNELREEVTYVDVEVWGKQAETASQYLSKGRSVMIEGRLKLDTWDDKTTGKKQYKLKVVGERIQFIGGGGAGGGAPAGAGAPRPAAGARPAPSRPAQHAAPSGPPDMDDGGHDFEPAPGAEDLNISEENIPF